MTEARVAQCETRAGAGPWPGRGRVLVQPSNFRRDIHYEKNTVVYHRCGADRREHSQSRQLHGDVVPGSAPSPTNWTTAATRSTRCCLTSARLHSIQMELPGGLGSSTIFDETDLSWVPNGTLSPGEAACFMIIPGSLLADVHRHAARARAAGSALRVWLYQLGSAAKPLASAPSRTSRACRRLRRHVHSLERAHADAQHIHLCGRRLGARRAVCGGRRSGLARRPLLPLQMEPAPRDRGRADQRLHRLEPAVHDEHTADRGG